VEERAMKEKKPKTKRKEQKEEMEDKVKESPKQKAPARYREFTVTPGMYGFKVKIGCSELYFSTPEQLSNAIAIYLKTPDVSENFFRDHDHRLNPIPVNVGTIRDALREMDSPTWGTGTVGTTIVRADGGML
jgi:hypothetical protein